MRMISCEWNACCNKYHHMWIADDESGITADFDPDCSVGSTIIVISTNSTWMKNTKGKWQKCGTNEVI